MAPQFILLIMKTKETTNEVSELRMTHENLDLVTFENKLHLSMNPRNRISGVRARYIKLKKKEKQKYFILTSFFVLLVWASIISFYFLVL